MSEATVLGMEYRRLADLLPQLIWVTDGAGSTEYVNQRFVEYTGYPAEELCGQTEWRKVLHPDDLERCLRDWTAAIATGTSYETEYRLRRASDATWRWHLARGLPIKDERDRIVKWLGTSTDIDEQKRIEESLRRSEQHIREQSRRKDEFLAMLGHELRNPLTPILGAAQLLRMPGAERAARAIDIIERQARHMARLVDDLLDVGRIQRGRIELRKSRVEIAAVVQAAVETTAAFIAERDHTLHVDVAGDSLAVDADPVRLAQVISNLLHNAAKYTGPGGRVTLRAYRAGDDVEVSVADTGMGISADDLPHVFDLFVQGERSLDRSQGGLGIGLTVVRRLVELHGGEGSASSAGPGRGSEFVVRLPAAPPAARPSPPIAAGAAAAAARPAECGRRVLLVDDNPDITAVLDAYLSAMGFDVRVACDGPSALAAVHETAFQSIVLDIGLPRLDGFEVARAIRDDARLASTRLIALTGYGQEADQERARRCGFDAYLVKPPDPAALAGLLA